MKRFLSLACRLVLGVVFIAAAVPKILAPHDFALAILRYQMAPYALINLMAVFMPWLELVAGVAILMPRPARGAAIILAGLLAVFTVAIAINLVRGVDMACGCFTMDPDAERIGWWNVARNLGLLAAAVAAMGTGTGERGGPGRPFDRRGRQHRVRLQAKAAEDMLAPLARDEELPKLSVVEDELPNLVSLKQTLATPALLRKHLRFLAYHFDAAGVDPAGKRILDVGSGLGLNTAIFSLWSGITAAGVDNSVHLQEISERINALLPPSCRPRTVKGDAAHLPFPDASFDVVTCFEALSHFRRPEQALFEMARVCAPGGAVIISDGNNSCNAGVTARTRAYWGSFEKGPSRTATTDGCHYIGTCYEELRGQIIAQHHPEIPEEARDRIAKATFGYNEAEVLQACAVFQHAHQYPSSVFDGTRVPVDPLRDDVRENLLDPFDLKGRFESMGFAVDLHPYFGAARGAVLAGCNRLVRQAVPPQAALRYSKLFILTARCPT